MIIKREHYVDNLVDSMHNGLIKVITGIRRCGKSFLLNNLFHTRLAEMGIQEENILFLNMEDWRSRSLRNPDVLLDKIETFAANGNQMYYVVIDEVQMVDHFAEVLNSLLHFENVDVFVTGSNSRFLSSDIATEFRGRSYEIHLAPLSFSEYLSAFQGTMQDAWDEYSLYGGLPGLLSMETDEKKSAYLRQLFNTVYLRDIMERNRIENVPEIKELIRVLASNVGSLTNINNLTNAFASKKKLSITNKTVDSYVRYFEESFIVEQAERYDIRGKQYIGAQSKYYFQDIGLRNALLSFRQLDRGHVMENIIYNELRKQGYSVDVGEVGSRSPNGSRINLEVDFVANKGSRRCYFQSAYQHQDVEKELQEKRSLLQINDSFKKLLVVSGHYPPMLDDNGIWTIGVFQFLSNPHVIDSL
jgi:predicted AAA+ superfamily ATPase